jgi:5-oxoprolinase (ATP-hydrolysing) subunit C
MALIVIDPGLSTTVQDAGRPGYRELGVPPGGAFDRGSADLANALVGNSLDCAVLEFTLKGGIYQADCPTALALAGAPMEATIAGLDIAQRQRHVPLSFSLAASERLVLGRALGGARTYLAVKGGWQTRVCLGSRSTETRVRAGDILPAAAATIPTRHPRGFTSPARPALPIRIITGIDAGSHPELGEAFWPSRTFRVGTRSDRMGIRLEGEPASVTADPARLSTPVSFGAVQVAGGQFIILGVACGTMGGYPHIAHVISADLDRLAQLQPGESLRFRLVTLDEARREDASRRQQRQDMLRRVTTLAKDV